MLRNSQIIINMICLAILSATAFSNAEEEIEDLIDIAESKGKIIAVIEGRETLTFDLRPKEKVLWSGSRGHLGAFLTDRSFFIVSTSLSAWQELSLRSREPEKGIVSLSPYMALLVTADRAVGFDAASNRFVETLLPIHDDMVTAEAQRYVAVVITSSRALALAAETSAFAEIKLRRGETIEEVKLTYSKAIVRTPDRLLTFEVSGARWWELRF